MGDTCLYCYYFDYNKDICKRKEKNMLGVLGLILLISILIIGGDRGGMSLVALCGNLFFLSMGIWLMAEGVPVFLVIILIGAIVSYITLFYQNGSNIKTWSAFIAVLVTMSVLVFVVQGVIWGSRAGGLNEIQSAGEEVLYYDMNLDISMQKVQVSVILLSTLGAVIDMAFTVTASLYEVKSHKPDMTNKELIESGIRVGKDVIGTTINTLLFAYFGESLLLLSYLKMRNDSLEFLLNSKILFQSCASMLLGAIACVLVMPISTVILAKMSKIKNIEKGENEI